MQSTSRPRLRCSPRLNGRRWCRARMRGHVTHGLGRAWRRAHGSCGRKQRRGVKWTGELKPGQEGRGWIGVVVLVVVCRSLSWEGRGSVRPLWLPLVSSLPPLPICNPQGGSPVSKLSAGICLCLLVVLEVLRGLAVLGHCRLRLRAETTAALLPVAHRRTGRRRRTTDQADGQDGRLLQRAGAVTASAHCREVGDEVSECESSSGQWEVGTAAQQPSSPAAPQHQHQQQHSSNDSSSSSSSS